MSDAKCEKTQKDRSPAMQFYFRQFAGDENVMAMDLDAVGAHILLMCAAGASEFGYRLANDWHAIGNRLRNPKPEDLERIKQQLLAGPWKASKCGKWLEQDGMRRILLKQKEFSAKQRRNALAKGQPNESQTTSQTRAKRPSSSSSSSSSTSTNDLTPTVLAVRSERITYKPKISMTESEMEEIQTEFGVDSVKYYLTVCSDWLCSNGKTKKSCAAFVRNWIRKDIAELKGFYYPKRGAPPGERLTPAERTMETAERMIREELEKEARENAEN